MKTNGLPVFSDSFIMSAQLVAVHLAGRAARHGKILARQMHQAAVDGGASGHDAIGRQIFSAIPK